MAESGDDQVQRTDDVFRVFIILSSFLLAFVRTSGIPPVKGLLPEADATITILAVIAMLSWGAGHISRKAFFKVLGWLIWSIPTAMLIVFVFWGGMLHLATVLSWPIRCLSVQVSSVAVIVTVAPMHRIYRQNAKKTVALACIALIAATLGPLFMIPP